MHAPWMVGMVVFEDEVSMSRSIVGGCGWCGAPAQQHGLPCDIAVAANQHPAPGLLSPLSCPLRRTGPTRRPPALPATLHHHSTTSICHTPPPPLLNTIHVHTRHASHFSPRAWAPLAPAGPAATPRPGASPQSAAQQRRRGPGTARAPAPHLAAPCSSCQGPAAGAARPARPPAGLQSARRARG